MSILCQTLVLVRPHVICAPDAILLEFSTAFINVVYILQGMFHPARKVRDVYWKVYNTIYIGAEHAMVPAYPRMDNDDRNTYMRYELDYVL